MNGTWVDEDKGREKIKGVGTEDKGVGRCAGINRGASAETWYYGYDEWNHLISVKKEQTDGGTLQMQATYTYDALGNRLEQDVWTGPTPGTLTVTRYAYDG